jgi:hypothetical protein
MTTGLSKTLSGSWGLRIQIIKGSKTIFLIYSNLSNPGKKPTKAAQSDISKKIEPTMRRKAQSLSMGVFKKKINFLIRTISPNCATDY